MSTTRADITVEQAAERFAVSTWTIKRLVRRGDLKASRVGRLLRFTERQLADYLARAETGGAPPPAPSRSKPKAAKESDWRASLARHYPPKRATA